MIRQLVNGRKRFILDLAQLPVDKGYIVDDPKARGGKAILFPGNDKGAWVLGWPTVKDLTANKILRARAHMRASTKPAPGTLIRVGLYDVDAKSEVAHPLEGSHFSEGAYTWIDADQFDFPAQGVIYMTVTGTPMLLDQISLEETR